MRPALIGAVISLIALAAPALRAQRVQLPSRLPETPSTLAQFTPNTSTAPGSGYLPGGTTIAPSAPAPATGGAPAARFSGGIQPFDPYGTQTPATTVLQPGAVTTQPVLPPASTLPVVPNGVAPPVVTTGPGAYYSPVPAGAPYTTSPPAIYPNGLPPMVPPSFPGQMSNIRQITRFLQEIRLVNGWVFDNDDPDAVDINSTEVSATFAVPAFGLQTPFLITPGFALNLFDGPEHVAATGFADLPPQTYDAFLDVGWNPQVNNWFSAELGVRTGVYTDFDHFSSDSFRIMGRGIAVVRVTPALAAKLGVEYIDRNNIKLLPVAGVVWDPSPDSHYEIVFPRPKLAHRWITLANHNLWYYVAGEYGGGSWTIVRQGPPEFVDAVDYNDIRVTLGLEWLPETQSGLRGFFEVGYLFKRELFYVSRNPDTLDLDDTFMLRGGIAF